MTEQGTRKIALYVLAAFVIGVVLTVGAFYLVPILPSQAQQESTSVQAPAVSVPVGSNVIPDIVQRTSPAVVLIETTAEKKTRLNYDPFFNDPFFREFFGGRLPFDSRTEVVRGMGSGFIISRDGYILTNEHVVSGADQIQVTIVGHDKPYKARIVGADHDLDLAVLKVDAGNNLPFLALGDSDKVRVGEWAIAIGNPHGLDHTVTVGVISAKGRPVSVQDRNYKNLLQTDASINPGNSGGPLLNLNGEVIGINTAVNAAAQGIGFAIPTSTVKPVLETLITKGKLLRPWLGVYIQSVTQDIASSLGLSKPEGVLITSLVEGGPAYKAGLEQYDVILEIDKQKISDTGALTAKVEKLQVGQKVNVLVFRNGKYLLVPVVIGDKNSNNQ
ncbi:MAG: trypsin-like peptidase domain-containing protein [Bacillota bacterium]|uniref:trypsin-like peptidase domain-containing protein n=1 Tax=Desulfurispora thermophila TaxID=265470 RepID=UPI00037FD14C|nr:trypsin-like peptidase domain-containing protein [Desulfurispora thermophila]